MNGNTEPVFTRVFFLNTSIINHLYHGCNILTNQLAVRDVSIFRSRSARVRDIGARRDR